MQTTTSYPVDPLTMSFRQLKSLLPATKGRATPSPEDLTREAGGVLFSHALRDLTITVYTNGFFLWQSDTRGTVYGVDQCRRLRFKNTHGAVESITDRDFTDGPCLVPLIMDGDEQMKRIFEDYEIYWQEYAAILDTLKRTDRKMEYMEVDLKRERFQQDQVTRTARFIPSREDSFERLQNGEGIEFAASTPTPEETVTRKDEYRRLKTALSQLTPEEWSLIQALCYEGLSERAQAEKLRIPVMTIHNRKVRVLVKLKNLMECKNFLVQTPFSTGKGVRGKKAPYDN